jgi:5'-3' exonuclease
MVGNGRRHGRSDLYDGGVAKGLTLLVDTSSLVYRALFSNPDSITTPDGQPVNAAYGFLSMLSRLVLDHDPAFLACATDEAWRPEWRVELIPAYKSARALPGSAQEQAEDRLEPQMPILFELLEACGVPVVGQDGYEAEDVIGTLAARAKGPVAIVSGDRDLFQLVRDPDVWVLYPKRGVSDVAVVNEAYIEDHYGIPGRKYLDYAVLRGDPSDGLPGVRGIGEKTASSLLATYGSLEKIVAAASASPKSTVLGKVARELDYVERAVQVVTIPTDLPLPAVDLTRPRTDLRKRTEALAKRSGLLGPVQRLAAAFGRMT